MSESRVIHNALLRLSCIGGTQFHYDPTGQVFGDGEIHYLAEFGGMYFLVWEDSATNEMVVNPITRFELDELGELGAEEAWTVLRVPDGLDEGIQFREIEESELVDAYYQTGVKIRTAHALAVVAAP